MPTNQSAQPQFTCRECGYAGIAWLPCNAAPLSLCNGCHIESVAEEERDEEEECNECGYVECECSGYFEEREYSTDNLPAFQSSKRGKYIKSLRIFSAEIECYYPRPSALGVLEHDIPNAIGVTGDGSLGHRGLELQTPKLKGANGEKQLQRVCEVLRKADYSVDRTTGLHIHLDGRGLLPRLRRMQEPTALKQLWYFYLAFDSVMLSFLPHSRRTNHYCHSMTTTTSKERIEAAKNIVELEQLWYKDSRQHEIKYRKAHKYDNSRYAGVNLHSLFASKHVEIRFHGGTLNAYKILEWIQLHQQILDLAAAKKLPIELIKQMDSSWTLEQKTALFFELLGLPQRTQKYFLQRQKTFAKSNGTEGQELESVGDDTDFESQRAQATRASQVLA